MRADTGVTRILLVLVAAASSAVQRANSASTRVTRVHSIVLDPYKAASAPRCKRPLLGNASDRNGSRSAVRLPVAGWPVAAFCSSHRLGAQRATRTTIVPNHVMGLLVAARQSAQPPIMACPGPRVAAIGTASPQQGSASRPVQVGIRHPAEGTARPQSRCRNIAALR